MIVIVVAFVAVDSVRVPIAIVFDAILVMIAVIDVLLLLFRKK